MTSTSRRFRVSSCSRCLDIETVVDAVQQRRPGAERVVLGTVGRVSGRGLYMGTQSRFIHLGMVPAELADDLAAAERLVELPDTLLQH